MKKILLMGPPGSGKGTQASALTQKFKWPVISAGDLLRAEIKNKTVLGEQIASIINQGHLVPDQLIIDVINHNIATLQSSPIVLIDGFPRTIGQAEALQASGSGAHAVINLAIDTEELVQRLSGRRIAPSSGRTYHLQYNPPLQDGVDDITGEELVQRPDDQPEHIRTRMQTYHASTAPLVSYYEEKAARGELMMITLNAAEPISDIFEKICRFIIPLTQGE